MLTSIPAYVLRFMIAMLPFLGLSGSEKSVDDVELPALEQQINVKKGNGLQPMETHGTCESCPPVC